MLEIGILDSQVDSNNIRIMKAYVRMYINLRMFVFIYFACEK